MQPEIPEGLHARFEHRRNIKLGAFEGDIMPVSSTGGGTHCFLEDADNNTVAIGTAVCNESDQYNKKIGRDISLGRALKNYYRILEQETQVQACPSDR